MKALITGASSGIGKEMALYLNMRDIDLILVSRDIKKLENIRYQFGRNTKFIGLDLSNIDNAYKLYDMVKDEKIDILINNAGFGLVGDFTLQDLDKELEMINLNSVTPHILTKLFLQDMVKRNSGYIMNVSSSAGFMAGPRMDTYYATKSYILRLTMAINEELKKSGSRVSISALCPGPTKTNFNKVANAVGSLKEDRARDVARYGIDKMFEKKMLIFPSSRIRMGNFCLRFMSFRKQLDFIYKQQTKKMKSK